jgi:hypothetical protein
LNPANGPDTKTALTLLVALLTISSFSGNHQEEHGHEQLRYADLSDAVTPLTSSIPHKVGITRTSA